MSINTKEKFAKRLRRIAKIRQRISGTQERPRLSINRTAKHLRVQLIDDVVGHTLLDVDSSGLKQEKAHGVKQAEEIGKILADRMAQKGIKKIVLDRRGYKYHGRIKKLAETLRAQNIQL